MLLSLRESIGLWLIEASSLWRRRNGLDRAAQLAISIA
jgi:hypothetical protein